MTSKNGSCGSEQNESEQQPQVFFSSTPDVRKEGSCPGKVQVEYKEFLNPRQIFLVFSRLEICKPESKSIIDRPTSDQREERFEWKQVKGIRTTAAGSILVDPRCSEGRFITKKRLRNS